MARSFAFLRAINVGGRTIKMEPLRREFEAIGCTAVETFIASGNVIFESRAREEAALGRKIEGQLAKAFGYEIETFLRSLRELEQILEDQPFGEVDAAAGQSVMVLFLSEPPAPVAAKNLLAASSETDEFSLHGREIYWLCRGRLSESKFTGPRLEKIVGARSTARNLKTVARLVARYQC